MLIAAAEAAADAAAAAIRPLFRTGVAADAKPDESPVTAADREAETAMRGLLTERFPGHGIIGEEFGADRAGASHVWVLDPLDGTRAFITGRPLFGTLVALLQDGAPVLGIIDQPISGERWVGVAGEPTRFSGGAGQVGVRPCRALAQAELSCTSPEMFDAATAPRWQRLRRAMKRATYGGDCYAYGLVALGAIDVVAEAGMQAWDWAALVPVIEGAGGRVTRWNGAPLRVGNGDVLAVGDPALLPLAVAVLGGA